MWALGDAAIGGSAIGATTRWRLGLGALVFRRRAQRPNATERTHTVAPARVAFHAFVEGDHAEACFNTLSASYRLGRHSVVKAVFTRYPLVVFAVERHALVYAGLSALRWMTGRQTIGFLSQGVPLAMARRFPDRAKCLVLARLRRLPLCRTLALCPFAACVALHDIADDWVYDPQIWGLGPEEQAAIEALRAERPQAPRPVVVSVGGRGFDRFTDLYTRRRDLAARFQFIVCGPVQKGSANYAAAFREAGGVAIDRVLSPAETLGIYAASDAVWCVGRLPHNTDVTRTIQLGVPLVVANGSAVHKLCLMENIPHVPIEGDPKTALATDTFPLVDPVRGRAIAERFRLYTDAALRSIIGF